MPKKKKCASEELKDRCNEIIDDEEKASVDYYSLSLNANSPEEKKKLEIISNQEARHAKTIKNLCKCKNK